MNRTEAPPRRRPAGTPGPTNPMDPRLRVRRAEVARARAVRRRRHLIVASALIVLALGSLGLVYRSPLLDVDRVIVQGATHAGPTDVRRVAGVAPGRPLASVDLGAARRRVLAVPWVFTARVSRRWPGTLLVQVVERVPVAVVGEGLSASFVDRTGRVLGPAAAAADLPAIVGAAPAAGERLDPPRRRLAAVVAGLPPTLRREVATGGATDRSLTFTLTDGVTVRWGDPGQSAAKADSLTALLTQAHRSTIATIDVSVPAAAALTRKDGPVA